jgi:hypothetical protein
MQLAQNCIAYIFSFSAVYFFIEMCVKYYHTAAFCCTVSRIAVNGFCSTTVHNNIFQHPVSRVRFPGTTK